MSFDRGVAVGLFVFSSWVLYLSLTMKHAAIRQIVGPEVMPIAITVCLMLASVVLFLRSGKGKPVAAGEGGVEVSEPDDFKTQALVILGMVVYIFAMEPLGYVLATALLCIYETTVFETGHWLRNILSGVGYSVAIYTLFVKFLEVLLPVGLLGW